MATLAEIQTEACEDGIAFITSNTRLLQIIAQLLNSSGMTLDEITAAACESGIADETSPQRLLVIIAQLLQGTGGGGVGCANIVGAGSPVGVVTPSCVGQFYVAENLYGAGQHGLFQAIGLTSADWVTWI